MNGIRKSLARVFVGLCLSGILSSGFAHTEGKPKVWIISDGCDSSLKRPNGRNMTDPDDVSAIGGYLLMSNMFETLGIVVASSHNPHHRTTPNQGEWARRFFGGAYAEDLPQLNKHIGGYQDEISFIESSLKMSGDKYDPERDYVSLEDYGTVQALIDEAEQSDEVINVLCWGSLTEPAILVNHCLIHNRLGVLEKLRFISHWTNSSFRVGSLEHPEEVHNCFNDADACAYMKRMALNGHIKFFECSGIGQYGIVEGSQKGDGFWEQFKVSRIGKIFAEGKYVKQRVDDSDCATYWTLLGDWGVGLSDVSSNGTNKPSVEQANEASFREWAPLIREEMLRRARAAANVR